MLKSFHPVFISLSNKYTLKYTHTDQFLCQPAGSEPICILSTIYVPSSTIESACAHVCVHARLPVEDQSLGTHSHISTPSSKHSSILTVSHLPSHTAIVHHTRTSVSWTCCYWKGLLGGAWMNEEEIKSEGWAWIKFIILIQSNWQRNSLNVDHG